MRAGSSVFFSQFSYDERQVTMRILPIIIAVVAIALVPLFAYTMFRHPVQCGFGHTALLQTPNQTLKVFLAVSSQEKAKGLGGCASLARKTGMYFPFSDVGPQTFWMKDMVMPIDIVWVSRGVIVGVDQNVPIPAKGAQDYQLALYHSPKDVDAVLEVGAGLADTYGLEQGGHVVLVGS